MAKKMEIDGIQRNDTTLFGQAENGGLADVDDVIYVKV